MDPKMYLFTCFILIVSVKGITSEMNNETSAAPNLTITSNTSILTTEISKSTPTQAKDHKTTPKSTQMSNTSGKTSQNSDQSKFSEHTDCLLNLKNDKEFTLWSMIALLVLICLLLLVIIMCLACKRCQGTRHNEMVMMKSSKITRNNSVNGVPCETDLRYSSVKVEIEATPDESQESQLVGGEAAEVGNEVSNEENLNTDETAPTQEVDQSSATDLKMEGLEKTE